MKNWMKVLISILILIVLVVFFYYVAKTVTAITGKSISGWASKIFK